MKLIQKICIFAALAVAFALSVSAQQDILKVSNATAKKGETFYLTVELTRPVEGNTVAVKYSYDSKLLKPVVESCEWVPSGGMANFDKANPTGVWSVQNTTQLKGGLCILAFRLQDGEELMEPTKVNCEVRVKEGTQPAKIYTATAVITMECAHTYGPWKDAGNMGHAQICTLCQEKHIQSHTWDQGKESQSKEPGKVEMLYTCTVCGGTKTVTQNKEQQILPTFSKPTEESPSQKPTQQQGPLTPTKKPGDIPEITSPKPNDPAASTGANGQETEQNKPTVPSHNHDNDPVHNHQKKENPVLTGAVIAVVTVAMIAAAVIIVKKKR